MAIQIIGQSKTAPEAAAPERVVPATRPRVDLPAPSTAPEAAPVVDIARVRELARHDSPLIRSFAIEKIELLGGDDADSILIELASDKDDAVAAYAIKVLGDRRVKAA